MADYTSVIGVGRRKASLGHAVDKYLQSTSTQRLPENLNTDAGTTTSEDQTIRAYSNYPFNFKATSPGYKTNTRSHSSVTKLDKILYGTKAAEDSQYESIYSKSYRSKEAAKQLLDTASRLPRKQ